MGRGRRWRKSGRDVGGFRDLEGRGGEGRGGEGGRRRRRRRTRARFVLLREKIK
jgi:hypothetical protein